VIILEEDVLPTEATIYKNLKCIKFSVDTMSNLELIVLYNYLILPEYQHSGPWLMLGRRSTEFRDYATTQFVPLLKHNVISTYGKENFIGENYDFYNQKLMSSPLTNLNNLISLQDVYNHTCGSIVVETTPVYGIITEKTFHAIASGHPFLMLAHQGAVQYLRDIGFDVFDDIFNHSYDQVVEYQQRFDRAINDNLGTLLNHLDRLPLASRLEKNRKHLIEFYSSRAHKFVQEIKSIWNT
jgi:hypothetical protein